MRLPNEKQRITILGRTGSGKTVAALFHLSRAPFDRIPYLIVDYKTDENINAIPGVRYIGYKDKIVKPGIYVAQPSPGDDAMTGLLEGIWKRGNTGVYVDEGYMIGQNAETDTVFRSLLTQGRSKRVPMIVLSQRPVWMNRFVFSESDFFQVFHLNDLRDRKTIESFLPPGSYRRMPDYHSLYYDVNADKLEYLAPVPDAQTIVENIDDRLRAIGQGKKKIFSI